MKKKFYWRFSRKIEGEFWIFYKRFPWEKNWMEEIFKRISLKNWSWIHTRASLARAVFSFKTFFDCEWRSHLPSPTTSTSWTEKRAKRVLTNCRNNCIVGKRLNWSTYSKQSCLVHAIPCSFNFFSSPVSSIPLYPFNKFIGARQCGILMFFSKFKVIIFILHILRYTVFRVRRDKK